MDTLGFDPLQKRETWIFQEIGRTAMGKPFYRRMGFNLVNYDGSPDQFIEPVSAGYHVVLTAANVLTVDNTMLDSGAVNGMMYVTARPFEVHSFGDPVAI